MIRSGRFWLLAPLQLVLYVFLIWFGCPYKPTWVAWVNGPSAIEGEEASGFGPFVLEWLDLSDQPYLEQLAIGLNSPAAFVGGLFAGSISWAAKEQLSGAKQELLSH